MILAFLTVGQQVLTLFILLAVGFAFGRLKLLDDRGSLALSNLMLYVVTPCLLVSAFQREKVDSDLHNFLLVLGMSVLVQVVTVALAALLIRDKDMMRQRTLRFAATFPNCGYMGYPLMAALFGSIGIYYGSAFVLVFNLMTWTWGIWQLTGEKKYLSWRLLLLNPGVLGVVVAMVLYLLELRLPDVLLDSVNYFGALNVPLPMVILGYQLSHADFKTVLQHRSSWVTLLLRLVVLPLLTLGLCLVLHLTGSPAVVLIIAVSTPAATVLSMFAAKFKTDTSMASGFVSVSTAFSAVTIPLLAGLAQYVLGA